MRLEHIPAAIGVLVALMGVALIADAWLPGASLVPDRERRRRERLLPNVWGESITGLGLISLAASLIGGDTWRYGTVAVIVGALLVLVGAAMNFRYLGQAFSFRGPARRQDERPPRPVELTPEGEPPVEGSGATNPSGKTDRLRVR